VRTGDSTYTSDNRVATSPTLSFTPGVTGANEGVLLMVPAAAGPWPFGGTVIWVGGVLWEEQTIAASLRIPSLLLSIFD
jgi:hypothetical protein